jgi:CHAT domain
LITGLKPCPEYKNSGAPGLGGATGIVPSADRHRLFHYVGHADVVPTDPFHAKLRLGAGEITLRDLQGRRFERLELVVLSACSSVAAEPTRTGGFLGLARPFLSGGVRTVTGALWGSFAPKQARETESRLRSLKEGSAARNGAQAPEYELRLSEGGSAACFPAETQEIRLSSMKMGLRTLNQALAAENRRVAAKIGPDFMKIG